MEASQQASRSLSDGIPGDKNSCQLAITRIGGPTALLGFGGLRLLTDLTFDPTGASTVRTGDASESRGSGNTAPGN